MPKNPLAGLSGRFDETDPQDEYWFELRAGRGDETYKPGGHLHSRESALHWDRTKLAEENLGEPIDFPAEN